MYKWFQKPRAPFDRKKFRDSGAIIFFLIAFEVQKLLSAKVFLKKMQDNGVVRYIFSKTNCVFVCNLWLDVQALLEV